MKSTLHHAGTFPAVQRHLSSHGTQAQQLWHVGSAAVVHVAQYLGCKGLVALRYGMLVFQPDTEPDSPCLGREDL